MTHAQLTNFLDRPDVRVKVDGLTVIVCDKQRRWEGTGATVAEAAEIASEAERKYRLGFPAMVAKDIGAIIANATMKIQAGDLVISPFPPEDKPLLQQLLLATVAPPVEADDAS